MLKNKHIFVINGSGGKGKNSLVDMVSEIYPTMDISSVDKVKLAAEVMGINIQDKSEKVRKLLSDLKILFTEFDDLPYKYMKRRIEDFNKYLYFRFIFLHVREPEEIGRLVKDFGAKTILVKNPNVDDIKSNMADGNVENYQYDYVIENDGSLEDLREKVRKFLEGLE